MSFPMTHSMPVICYTLGADPGGGSGGGRGGGGFSTSFIGTPSIHIETGGRGIAKCLHMNA